MNCSANYFEVGLYPTLIYTSHVLIQFCRWKKAFLSIFLYLLCAIQSQVIFAQIAVNTSESQNKFLPAVQTTSISYREKISDFCSMIDTSLSFVGISVSPVQLGIKDLNSLEISGNFPFKTIRFPIQFSGLQTSTFSEIHSSLGTSFRLNASSAFGTNFTVRRQSYAHFGTMYQYSLSVAAMQRFSNSIFSGIILRNIFSDSLQSPQATISLGLNITHEFSGDISAIIQPTISATYLIRIAYFPLQNVAFRSSILFGNFNQIELCSTVPLQNSLFLDFSLRHHAQLGLSPKLGICHSF